MRRQTLYILVAFGIGIIAIMFAVFYKPSAGVTQKVGHAKVTMAELSAKNGKGNTPCWVAVDGTVYDIDESEFGEWQNGVHTTSDGKAKCGEDLSNVIDESPHGRSVLQLLTIVGQLDK